MDLTPHLNTNNWFDYTYFYEWLAKESDINVMVEVGSWKGHSITHLAKQFRETRPQFLLFAVDIWNDWEKSTDFDPKTQAALLKEVRLSYQIFIENLTRAGIRDFIVDIKLDSHTAPKLFPDEYFDCVFLDADHTFEAVTKDIELWRPKIRKGGLIAGHDYDQPSCGVKKAVDKIFPDVKCMGQVWYKRLN